MEKMSALDASFLDIEDAVSHMHIGSIGILEGPAPPYEELRAMVLAKLPLVPRYRQVVRAVPLSIGRPHWVDDQHFNLDYHLRHTGLPAPGERASCAAWWVASCPSSSTAPSRSGRCGSWRGSRTGAGR